MKKKVIVGMSGGVDSSVTAYLLKKQGHDVIGVFMQNWDPYLNNDDAFKNDENSKCEAEQDFEVAKSVADHLQIPIYRVNFIKEYWTQVFEPFLHQYKSGITPNPDVLCNKYIKFGAFHDYCFNNFKDIDYIATGHYAGVGYNEQTHLYELKEAKDAFKDQTYFLCSLNQKQLSKTWFPLGQYTKYEIREIAKQNGLDNWNRKDSTGICFIGERNFQQFLKNYINPKKGPIIDIKTNQQVGEHNGIYYYTIGQRKGLNLSGFNSRYFVCKKDPLKNIIYVTSVENEDEFLLSTKAIVNEFNWIGNIPSNNNIEVRFRHTQKKISATFNLLDNNKVVVIYKDKSKAVTEGQYLVMYQNGVCLGGGQISEVSI